MEDAVLVGRALGPLDEGLPVEQVGLVEDEQVVIEALLGGVGGLFHESLPVHA